MGLLQHSLGITTHIVEKRLGKRLDIDPNPNLRPRYFKPDSSVWWPKGYPPQRDSWKTRVYRAEDRLMTEIEQRTFANITEVAKYVRDVMEKPWFQRRFPLFEQCEVRYLSGASISRGGPRKHTDDATSNIFTKEVINGRISLTSCGMGKIGEEGGELVVLHELTHAILPRLHHHDRRFARTYLELVGCIMGHPVRGMLVDELRREGMLYSPYKKIKFSEEHMARLAAARPNPKK